MWIIIFITLVFIISAITGVYKGIKLLSNFNTYLALALLVVAFLVGPKISILNNLTNSDELACVLLCMVCSMGSVRGYVCGQDLQGAYYQRVYIGCCAGSDFVHHCLVGRF